MSAKLIGDPEWVLQPGYPKLSGQDGGETLTVEIVATADGLRRYLPRFGDPFHSEDPFFGRYYFLTLSGRDVEPMKGNLTYRVSLTFDTSNSDDDSAEAIVIRECEKDTQDTDVPIEQHRRYCVSWNYALFAKTGITATPGWWESATTRVMSPDDVKQYMWLKPGEPAPDGWYLLKEETMANVESFRDGITTVLVIERSTNKRKLQRQAKLDYTIQSPPDTFGRSGEWLRGGSKLRKNGRYWEQTVPYLNSAKIDRRLYN